MSASSLSQARALIAKVSTHDLEVLIADARAELTRRRSDEMPDLDVVVRAQMQRLAQNGVRAPQQVGPGMVALGGLITESGERHKCQLFTLIDSEGGAELWAWDDDMESLVHTDTSKVGQVRSSVAIHAVMPGTVMVRHRMAFDGQRHSRTSVTAWRVSDIDASGGVRLVEIPWVATSLPPPHHKTAARPAGVERVRAGHDTRPAHSSR